MNPVIMRFFIGTHVAMIQELTNIDDWRYVNSNCNPNDDLARDKTAGCYKDGAIKMKPWTSRSASH